MYMTSEIARAYSQDATNNAATIVVLERTWSKALSSRKVIYVDTVWRL